VLNNIARHRNLLMMQQTLQNTIERNNTMNIKADI